MAYNFHAIDRNQPYLLPQNMADWLEEGHLAWFILEAVEQMDLSGFYRTYRHDGRGNTSYHPQMMVALLMYGYSYGQTSSRQLERLCQTDVAYRVISAQQFPDHTTIARFRQKHSAALKELFLEVLKLCARAGLGKLGTVALDGTKMKGNASLQANRTEAYLQKEIERMLQEAEQTDRVEDERYGKGRRDDELPPDLQKREQQRQKLQACREQLRQEKEQADNERRAKEEDRQQGFVQGYNAQALVSEDQVILAAEIAEQANDQGLLHPLIRQAQMNIEEAGYDQTIKRVTADAGYCNEQDLSNLPADSPELYVATQKSYKQRQAAANSPGPRGRIPEGLTVVERMGRKLLTKLGQAIYALRSQLVEPVFGQIKEGMGIRQFSCRGLASCAGEWSLICAVHNLLKLFRSGKAVWAA